MAGRRSFGQILKGRRKGTWNVRWHERGRLRQKTIAGSKSLADGFLARTQSKLGEEEVLGVRPVSPKRFEALVSQYEDLFHGEKAPATVIREAQYVRSKMLPTFKGMRIDRIGRADIERFLIKRTTKDRISATTRNKMVSMLSRLFQKAQALDHCRRNPVAGIRRQREPLLPVPFVALDTQSLLIVQTPESMRSLVTLLLDTGLRLGEALRLEWRDVDFGRSVVTVRRSKNKTGREVPFTTRGRESLRVARTRHDDSDLRVPDLVFPELVEYAVTGESRLKTMARRAWTRARKRAGLPHLRLHDLRHVWAVTCVRAGVSLSELRELGGWKSLHMVLRYSRHVPENTPDRARIRLEAFVQAGEDGHVSGHGSGG